MSVEHCLTCFEALDAHLGKRKPMTLDEIQQSYAAYKSSSAQPPPSSSPSGPAKDPTLLRVAADGDSATSSSASSLGGSSTPATSISSFPIGGSPTSTPLFVTWNTVEDDGETSLRGCIGTFEAQPLATGLPEYAVISAVHDTRFSPVSRAELPELQAVVTLLTDFEEVDDKYDWEVGVHGIRLSFYDKGRRFGSTYLPDVASEQGWTQDEALLSLIRKAGWMGSRSRWQDLDLKVTRYQGKKASVEYDEFKKWRDWVDSRS